MADGDDEDGGDGDGDGAEHTETHHSADQDEAQGRASSNASESGRDRGTSDTVEIDGCPSAQPGATATISGIRDGVDGSYLISRVTHSLSRGGGFTTKLELKQPSGGAGSDSRTSSTDSTSSDTDAPSSATSHAEGDTSTAPNPFESTPTTGNFGHN